jgi:PIN domain nuclease of toxin-antitoxin system
MSSVVLDASAIVAFIRNEPGATVVTNLAEDALVSAVNVAEVVTYFAGEGLSEEAIRVSLAKLAFASVPFDEEQAWKTGLLRPITRHLGLSLGDRACLNLASSLNLPVLTADRPWTQLDLGVDVQLIR